VPHAHGRPGVVTTEPLPITTAIAAVRRRIEQACDRADRDPESVELLAVSKMQPAARVREAAEAGQWLFGENYVQHWQSKAEAAELVGLSKLRWHFIGALQRNKIRFLLGRVHFIETVDRAKLAEALSTRCLERPGGRPQQVLLEVNLGAERDKAGFLRAELHERFADLLALPGLEIDGLMSIPPQREVAEASRVDHCALAELRARLQDDHGHALPTLSMGMSADFEVAIEEGSTRVRIGTGIFGPRPPRQ